MFEETKHPRDGDGKFTEKGEEGAAEKTAEAVRKYSDDPARDLKGMGYGTKQKASSMTPEEKIASVHIDFSKDNILPELNEDSLTVMGLTKNKQVLLKKSVIDRNAEEHSEIGQETFQTILAETLYSPKTEIFPANKEKQNYFHFSRVVRENEKFTLVLLDIDETKEHFEVVHAYFVYVNALKRARNKAKK